MELEATIASIGEDIVSDGLEAAAEALTTMASAARPFAPGAADALADRDLPDAVRYRAYARVGAALIRNLDRMPAAHLLAVLEGRATVSSAA